MAELEIDGTHEEQWGIMKSAVKQHHSVLMGNGQPGIVDFVSGTKAQLRLLIALVSVVGVIVSILAMLEANRQIHSRYSQNPASTDLSQATLDAYQPYGGK